MVNPVVILSTYAAFGWGPVLIGRLVFSVLIAFAVGLLFSFAQPEDVLLPETLEQIQQERYLQEMPKQPPRPFRERIWQALAIGADDFLDMARYLIIGSLLAAGMQTIVPQSTLLALGTGPIISVIVMMTLAFVLSICSTVDAFVALSFTSNLHHWLHPQFFGLRPNGRHQKLPHVHGHLQTPGRSLLNFYCLYYLPWLSQSLLT